MDLCKTKSVRMQKAFIFALLLFFCPSPLYGWTMNPIFPGAGRPAEKPRFGEPRKIKSLAGREIYLILNPTNPPSDAKGVVLYFHGNGEVVEDLDYLLSYFHKARLTLILVEYPGYGHAPGSPSEKEIYQTALEAYDGMKKEFPNLPFIAAGWSLGSSVAAYVASEREVSHLFMLSAMTSMKEVIRRLMPLVPDFLLKGNEFETTRFISKVKAPVTLIHGEEDDLVPFSMGQELKRILGERAKFIPLRGASHNDLFFRGASQIEGEILSLRGKNRGTD
jgi:alpha-beta hydrolase superfamily lysophospholipase